MDVFLARALVLLALAAVPPVAYGLLYAMLRLSGTLRVNRGGWHAAELAWRGRQLAPAMRVFDFFQAPMRLESSARTRLGRGAGDAGRDQAISDVVVELVRMA